jgi:hypothetical protein
MARKPDRSQGNGKTSHAVLGDHVPDAAPWLIAAVLAARRAGTRAGGGRPRDRARGQVQAGGVRIVFALDAEHHALDTDNPIVVIEGLPVLLTSTSDEIVALTSSTRRAIRCGDVAGFLAARSTLVALTVGCYSGNKSLTR